MVIRDRSEQNKVKMFEGGQGWWMRDGGNSEKGLRWSQVWVIKESFEKHFEKGSR